MGKWILGICIVIGIGSLRSYTYGAGAVYAIGMIIGIGIFSFFPDNPIENFIITERTDFTGVSPLIISGHMCKRRNKCRLFSSIRELYIFQIIIGIQLLFAAFFEIYYKFGDISFVTYYTVVDRVGTCIIVAISGYCGVGCYLRYVLLKRRKRTTYLKYKWKPFHTITVLKPKLEAEMEQQICLREMKSRIKQFYMTSECFLDRTVKKQNLEIAFYGKEAAGNTKILAVIVADRINKAHIQVLNDVL